MSVDEDEVTDLHVNRSTIPVRIDYPYCLRYFATNSLGLGLSWFDFQEYISTGGRQELQCATHVMDHSRVTYAKVIGNHVGLSGDALASLPLAEREGSLHGHLGHQESPREAIGSELPAIKCRRLPLSDELIYPRSVTTDVMTELVTTGESAASWGTQRRENNGRPGTLVIHSLHARDVNETNLYSEPLGEIVDADSPVQAVASTPPDTKGCSNGLPGYGFPVHHLQDPPEVFKARISCSKRSRSSPFNLLSSRAASLALSLVGSDPSSSPTIQGTFTP